MISRIFMLSVMLSDLVARRRRTADAIKQICALRPRHNQEVLGLLVTANQEVTSLLVIANGISHVRGRRNVACALRPRHNQEVLGLLVTAI